MPDPDSSRGVGVAAAPVCSSGQRHPAKACSTVPGLGIFGIVDLELAHLNKVQIATMWVSSLLACFFLGGGLDFGKTNNCGLLW